MFKGHRGLGRERAYAYFLYPALRGEDEERVAEMKIELPVNAHLSHDYVQGERLRLGAYRKLAAP